MRKAVQFEQDEKESEETKRVPGQFPKIRVEFPAGDRERRLAWTAALSLILGCLFVVPFAKQILGEAWVFVAVYQSMLIVAGLVTAVLLFSMFFILRSKALFVLANGYLFSAFVMVVYSIVFPGPFSLASFSEADSARVLWVYAFQRGGFPLFVIGYALCRKRLEVERPIDRPVSGAILKSIAILFAFAFVLALSATREEGFFSLIAKGEIPPTTLVIAGVWIVNILALLVLWLRRLRSALDLWLMVSMCAWIGAIALAGLSNNGPIFGVSGSFDVGFYIGRIYGLLAGYTVPLFLFIENSAFYVRMVEAHERELLKNQELQVLSEKLEHQTAAMATTLEALHQHEEEMRLRMDNLLECVVTIDTHGIVRSANRALQAVLGYRFDEVVGHNVSMLMPEPERSAHDGYLERYLRTGKAHIIGIGREVEGLHKDGRRIPLELSITRYTVRNEIFFIGVLRDISERRQFIADLTQARADAEQASRAKSFFLAAMSHEIRTPMNGVIGMADVLAHDPLSERQMRLVGTMRQSAATLLGIIDDILDFSKIEAGRLQIDEEPLSVADLVEDLCASLTAVAAGKNVDIAVFVSPELPERILADGVRLRQVLYNLVGNAIKFSGREPPGRGFVSVRVEAAEAAGRPPSGASPGTPVGFAFRIADNGIGIAPEALPHLFAPFTQAEASTTRRFGGTGLGLAICRRLVELMHGDIDVSSTPGIGSVFTVTLPFMPTEKPLPHEPSWPRPQPLPDVSGISCILVGDGLELCSNGLRAYLEYGGALVDEAADGAAAARIAAGREAPVVIIGNAEHEYFRHPVRGMDDAGGATGDGSGSGSENGAGEWKGPGLITAPDTSKARYLALRYGDTESPVPPGVSVLDGSALSRRTLLTAVAVAAGRVISPPLQEDSAKRERDDAADVSSLAEEHIQGRLILIVEDDEINQQVFLQQIGLLGYAAEIAENGVEALRMLRTGNYGLLMTDLHMPEMDGYMLTEMIRREEKERESESGKPVRMPILLVTANALRRESARAYAAGVDAFLTKPVMLEQLKAALERWLPGGNRNPVSERMTWADADEGAIGAERVMENAVAGTLPEGDIAPAVDVSVLRMYVGDDARVVLKFLSRYLVSTRRIAGQLRAAYAMGDSREVGVIAHKLKSSSRTVGALALGDICAELESAGRAGERGNLEKSMMKFETALAAVEKSITGFLGTEHPDVS